MIKAIMKVHSLNWEHISNLTYSSASNNKDQEIPFAKKELQLESFQI